MLVDGSGHLLYVNENGQLVSYVINPATGALTASPNPPNGSPLPLTLGNTVADPVEPYLYSLQSGQLEVFAITDITTGALVQNGSPFPVGGAPNLTLTHNAAGRSSTPLAALLNPSSLNFNETDIGQSSSGASALLTNTGTQSLDITSTPLSDQTNFAKTTNCPLQLALGSVLAQSPLPLP